MFDWSWILTPPTDALMVVVSATAALFGIILFTRLAGLRSFSKMSSFDFVVTVAMGSMLAAITLTDTPSLLQGLAALGALYALQYLIAFLRPRFQFVEHMVDNTPVLLMAGQDVLHDHLRRERITMDDLKAKLREANVIHPTQIRAVVLETTGDISVLHADPKGPDLDLWLFSDVQGIDHLRGRPGVVAEGEAAASRT